MQTRLKALTWRVFTCLVLLTFVFMPAANLPIQTAQAQEGTEPDVPLAAGDHLVTGLTLSPDSPNILRTDQNVTVSFSYTTNQAGGVLIFARPFTDGALTPGYGADGSPLYPTGSGQGSNGFTIMSGTVVVDAIRIQILNSDQSVLLFETFLPVYYLFTDAIHAVTNVNLTPDTPDVLKFNQHGDMTFDYITRQVGGVRIWILPFTNGVETPHYGVSGSPLYATGGGSGTNFFTVSSGPVVVDQIRIQMWDDDETILLFEAFLPVYYRFYTPTNIVTHIEFSPDTPNIFKYNQDVNLSFLYTTDQKSGVRIFARPFSGTGLSPSYGAHGSGIYPVGSGQGAGFFRLTAGPVVVDKVRVQMWNDTQTTLLFEAFLPVHLLWAGSGPPPGPDMKVDAIEVTQAVQDLNNSVDLVAGKRTYVRVHVSSPVNALDVFATLKGKQGAVNLNPILNPGNPGGDITVRPTPDRGQINDSFWFELPAGWTTAGNLTLTAKLDPNNAKFDPATANNTKSVTVNFKTTPPLRLRIVNVQYTSGGTTYLESSNHLDALESWLRRAYPINSLQVTRQNFVYPTNGLPNVDTLHGWLAMIKLLRMLFSGEDSRVVYYGVVDDGGGFMRGKAAGIPGTIAAGPSGTNTWGWDFDGSYNDWYGGHEIGHTRGRYHAEFCGAGGGAAYPYPGGRISPSLTGNTALYGFDVTTRAIYGPSWNDVMTYCSNQWVSDFTYEGIRNYLVGVGLEPLEPQYVTANDFLIVVGLADLDSHTATLESVQKISQNATLPLPDAGDWSIVLLDAGSNELATHPFAPDELTDAGEGSGHPAVIGEIVPWVAGTVKVEIRYQGTVVASRTASANAPTVTITAPNASINSVTSAFTLSWTGSDLDSDPLTYSVLYSNDAGATWQALATNLTTTSMELNTDQLPGGSALLRVLASDGLLSGSDTSTAFDVPLHAPSAQIDQPNDGQAFFPAQQVSLQGSGYDLEDDTLPDSAFAWASSIDGALGSGTTLNTSELSSGQHTITLTVTDSNGMTTQATRTITIGDENAAEVVNLDVAPNPVGLVVGFGSSSETLTVTLRSSSETVLDWAASEDLPWLTLSATSGATPYDLLLTIDLTQLSVGTHTGKITFTSAGAANSPVDLPISVQVTGYALFLPIIIR